MFGIGSKGFPLEEISLEATPKHLFIYFWGLLLWICFVSRKHIHIAFQLPCLLFGLLLPFTSIPLCLVLSHSLFFHCLLANTQ